MNADTTFSMSVVVVLKLLAKYAFNFSIIFNCMMI
jgi:hypothetical protein